MMLVWEDYTELSRAYPNRAAPKVNPTGPDFDKDVPGRSGNAGESLIVQFVH